MTTARKNEQVESLWAVASYRASVPPAVNTRFALPRVRADRGYDSRGEVQNGKAIK